jgi:hypothetical protein
MMRASRVRGMRDGWASARRLARASLAWAAACSALASLHCLDFDWGHCPNGCGVNQICVPDVGCVTPAGACTSDADCSAGEVCADDYSVRTCQRDTGADGEPCGNAPGVPACVPQATCRYHDVVMVTGIIIHDPAPSSIYFESSGTSRSPALPICIADGSLGEGEFCSDAVNCAPGLICHGGYEPSQCRPPSDGGGPCNFATDCRSGLCEPPDSEALGEARIEDCAMADSGCDIRLRPACGYWLSCYRCAPVSE